MKYLEQGLAASMIVQISWSCNLTHGSVFQLTVSPLPSNTAVWTKYSQWIHWPKMDAVNLHNALGQIILKIWTKRWLESYQLAVGGKEADMWSDSLIGADNQTVYWHQFLWGCGFYGIPGNLKTNPPFPVPVGVVSVSGNQKTLPINISLVFLPWYHRTTNLWPNLKAADGGESRPLAPKYTPCFRSGRSSKVMNFQRRD